MNDGLTVTPRCHRWLKRLAALAAATLLASLAVRADPVAGAGASPPTPATWAADHWPMFRGPTGQGLAGAQSVPVFAASTGEGILWKTPVPLPGMNSPVVWGGRVFLAGADRDERKVFGFDAADGRLLWSTRIATPQSAPSPKVMEDYTGYAAPTAATDGRAVYALFANGDLAAVDFDGAILWYRSLGAPENIYGHAASLLIHGERLILQLDQDHALQGLSRLFALDTRTGRTLWDVARPVSESWATPVIVRTASGEQLVTAANPYVIAYDPLDGRERWRARTVEGDVAFTPVFADGLVFAATPDLTLFAIRVDGCGDVTETHVAWRSEHGVPDITSPVTDGRRLLMVTTYGLLTLHDVTTGTLIWKHYIDGEEFFGSPILADGRFYLLSHAGRLYAVDAADAPHVRQVGSLGETTFCSPALTGGRLYIRGVRHLYGIGPTRPAPDGREADAVSPQS